MSDSSRVLLVGIDGTDGIDRSRLEDELSETAIVTSLSPSAAHSRLANGTVDCLVVGSFDGDESFLRTAVSEQPTVPIVQCSPLESPAGELESVEYVDATRPGAPAILAARIETALAKRRVASLEPIVTDHRIFTSMLERLPVSLYAKDETATHIRASQDQVTPPIETPDGELLTEPEELLGKTDRELYAPNLADDTYQDDLRVIETGEPVIGKIEHYEVGPGDHRWTTTSKVPWTDAEGSIRGLVGATIDVTAEIEHERELERQHEHLEEFANVVAHDLRNPLNVARGYVDLAQQTGNTDLLEDVDHSLERMHRLIEDVLLLARQGNAALTTTAVSLASVLEDAWSHVSTDEASFQIAGDVRFQADRGRLLQLVENLLRNAVDHGHQHVVVTVDPLTADDGTVIGFALEDDGPGIDPDARETVFESGYTTSEEGTGFGLAIVEQIVEAHGWTISVCEGVDGGARFEVRGVDPCDR